MFVTGVVLLFGGPTDRNPMLLLHKLTLHRLGRVHRACMSSVTCRRRAGRSRIGGREQTHRGARSLRVARAGWIALTGAMVGGLVLAVVLIPDFAAWTSHGAFLHHHHYH